MEEFISAIWLWPSERIPMGFLPCEGQLLPIKQYTPLFALIGTTYGGDGKNNFALPDLRGLLPIGMGCRAGGSHSYSLNETGGTQMAEVNLNQFPSHNHSVSVSVKEKCNTSSTNNSQDPGDKYQASLSGKSNTIYNTQITSGEFMTNLDVNYNDQVVGGNQRHENMPPYQALRYIICYMGYFPQRD